MAFITLDYTVERGLRPAAALLAKVSGVPLFQGELDLLSMSVFADTTILEGVNARRRVVLETDATSDENFPTDEAKIFVTVELYGQALALQVPGVVDAAAPVVS